MVVLFDGVRVCRNERKAAIIWPCSAGFSAKDHRDSIIGVEGKYVARERIHNTLARHLDYDVSTNPSGDTRFRYVPETVQLLCIWQAAQQEKVYDFLVTERAVCPVRFDDPDTSIL